MLVCTSYKNCLICMPESVPTFIVLLNIWYFKDIDTTRNNTSPYKALYV